jgi:hypothetical protein
MVMWHGNSSATAMLLARGPSACASRRACASLTHVRGGMAVVDQTVVCDVHQLANCWRGAVQRPLPARWRTWRRLAGLLLEHGCSAGVLKNLKPPAHACSRKKLMFGPVHAAVTIVQALQVLKAPETHPPC